MLKAKIRFLVIALATLMVSAVSDRAVAQTATGSEVSIYIGSMLPNQIDGITDILPVFGGRFGLGTKLGMLEFGAANTHAEGVDFTTAEFNIRGDFDGGQGLTGLIYAGADFNYYTPVNETSRHNETGLHLGIGGMMLVTDAVWLRTDLKFMGGPGTSLYLLFGLVFKTPN